MSKINVYDLTYEDWLNWVEKNAEPRFRAQQIYDWLYLKNVNSFKEMSNLTNDLRARLDKQFAFQNIVVAEQIESANTIKFLLKFEDGQTVETVLMRHQYGNSICISTQVGCKMGCSFCASTMSGWRRDLTAGEMVGQFLQVERYLNKKSERISSIVIMGIGEPFDNFTETMNFIKIANSENGLNIGQRHITISTSGIVPAIYRFADLKTQVVLAISLHAANNQLRSQLMPINERYPIEDLMAAVTYYVDTTGRRITFEYALIRGVNDSEGAAIELAKLLKGIKAHVNLIPINPVSGKSYERSSNFQLNLFKETLEKYMIKTTIRREYGSEIAAACGQLRSKDLT